jgi:hypothetical protein
VLDVALLEAEDPHPDTSRLRATTFTMPDRQQSITTDRRVQSSFEQQREALMGEIAMVS